MQVLPVVLSVLGFSLAGLIVAVTCTRSDRMEKTPRRTSG